METKKVCIVVIGFLFAISSTVGWAKDDYPTKPIEVIIPYPPGGPVDLVARIVGEKMTEYLGQPIVVVSKAGGAGAVGTSFVAKSKPDGYTFLATSCGIVTRPLFDPTVPYRINEFVPIGIFQKFNHIILVTNNLPVRTLAELVDYAKKNPKTLSYGISGIGGTTYLAVELLKLKTQMTDIQLQCVPYAGDNPALVALIGNHVQVSATTVSPSLPHIKDKAIRPLAILNDKREPLLPEVPTTVEQGFPEVLAACYHCLLAPAKTPQLIIKKLESAMEKALQDKAVKEQLGKIEFPADFVNSVDTQAFMDSDGKKWAEVIKKANLGTKK